MFFKFGKEKKMRRAYIDNLLSFFFPNAKASNCREVLFGHQGRRA